MMLSAIRESDGGIDFFHFKYTRVYEGLILNREFLTRKENDNSVSNRHFIEIDTYNYGPADCTTYSIEIIQINTTICTNYSINLIKMLPSSYYMYNIIG